MLSVVTVTFNSGSVIPQFLESVKRLPIPTAVVAVDNGSTDATLEHLSASGAVQIVSGHGNVGFGAAMNRGVREAPTGAVLLLNPDARPVEADEALLRRFVQSAGPWGVTACATIMGGHRTRYDLRPETDWREELVSFLARCFLKPGQVHLPRRPSLARDARWASGAALLVRQSEFLTLGGFDERYFMYYEDRDLCRRYSLHDLPINKSVAVRVEHDVGASSPVSNPIRLAWSLLGLVQYTAIHSGTVEARAAARAARRALSTIARNYTRLGERRDVETLRRKGREAQQARDALDGSAMVGAVPSSVPFYPDALRLFGEC